MLSTSKRSEKKPANPKKAPGSGPWTDALLPYINTPEAFPDDVLFFNDEIVAIKDKYPKSKHHYLLMPRPARLGFSGLTQDDLPWISAMKRAAQRIICTFDGSNQFKMGFHAVPSMRYAYFSSLLSFKMVF